MNSISEKIIKFYKDLLRVNDWDIHIYEEKTLDSDGACKALYSQNVAIIKIRDELSFEEKIKALIHELLHIKDRDERGLVELEIEGNLHAIYIRHHERFVESQAQVIYALTKDKALDIDT